MTDAELTAIDAKQPLFDRWGLPWGWAIPWSVAEEMDADIGRLTAEVRRLRALVKEAYEEGARDADPYGAGDAVWGHSHAHKALEGA
jgi:hypothetical protein